MVRGSLIIVAIKSKLIEYLDTPSQHLHKLENNLSIVELIHLLEKG